MAHFFDDFFDFGSGEPDSGFERGDDSDPSPVEFKDGEPTTGVAPGDDEPWPWNLPGDLGEAVQHWRQEAQDFHDAWEQATRSFADQFAHWFGWGKDDSPV